VSRLRAAAAGVFLAGLLIAGCGGSDNGGVIKGTPTGVTTTTAAPTP
jgi:hypothetical protein